MFDTRLGKIDGFGDIGRDLVNLVKAKTVVAPAAAVAKQPQSEKGEKDADVMFDASAPDSPQVGR